MPPGVRMSEDMRVAFWSEEKQRWGEDGLTEYTYHPDTGIFTFYTTAVGILALVKERVGGFPYKSWSLSVACPGEGGMTHPSYGKLATLSLSSQQIEQVKIGVRESSCVLIKPDDYVFADMIGVEMSPGQLLYTLQRRGVNFLPTSLEIEKVESIPRPVKQFSFEQAVLEEMSKYANTLDYHCCPAWNYGQFPTIGESRIGLMVREATAYTSCEAFDYECVLAEQDLVSETFLNAPSDGVNFVRPVLPAGEGAAKFLLVHGNRYFFLSSLLSPLSSSLFTLLSSLFMLNPCQCMDTDTVRSIRL